MVKLNCAVMEELVQGGRACLCRILGKKQDSGALY